MIGKSLNDDYISINNTKFYFDYQDGKYGYNTSSLRGADTFSPFNNGTELIYLGTGNSFNVSSYSGYKNFTVNNFVINPTGGGRASATLASGAGGPCHADAIIDKTYNSSTGAFTVNFIAKASAFTSYPSKAFSKKVYLAPSGLPS